MSVPQCAPLLLLGCIQATQAARTVAWLATTAGWNGPAPGDGCEGSLFSSGTCGSFEINDLDGSKRIVSADCYDMASHDLDSLAGWGKEGTCLIPKGGECDDSEQCQRGTWCLPVEGGKRFTCQEQTLAHGDDAEDPAVAAANLAAVVRVMADGLLASDEVMQGEPFEFFDPRSGAFSPYTAHPRLGQQVLASVKASFASAHLQGESAASRSGALFVLSRDQLFLTKSVREEEYKQLSRNLLSRLVVHSDLQHSICPPGSGTSCWANATLARTVLNIPVLAFPFGGSYWVVMPVAASARALAAGVAAEAWGKAAYYDVKPAWAKSKERPEFMKLVQRLGIHPIEKNAPEEMRSQWQRLQQIVNRDIDFLSESSEGQPFIDYSLLFEVYQPGYDVNFPGVACIKAMPCFTGEHSACRVVCVSIIDYFTRYNWKRHLESVVKSFKFHDYAQKTKDLLDCAFNMPVGKLENAPLGGAAVVRIDIDVRRRSHDAQESDECEPYLGMACDDVSMESSRPTSFDWSPGSVHGICENMTCTFRGQASRLRDCAAWLPTSCSKELSKWNEDKEDSSD